MKLETSLPERPGLLHVLPLFDIFCLLLLSFLLGPSFVLQSGVRVDPPPSRFQLERFEDTLVVTLATAAVDADTVVYLGREPVTPDDLVMRLAGRRENGAATTTVVLLKSDARTSVAYERMIAESILAAGFRLALVGRLEDSKDAPPEESPNLREDG